MYWVGAEKVTVVTFSEKTLLLFYFLIPSICFYLDLCSGTNLLLMKVDFTFVPYLYSFPGDVMYYLRNFIHKSIIGKYGLIQKLFIILPFNICC